MCRALVMDPELSLFSMLAEPSCCRSCQEQVMRGMSDS